MQQGLKKKRGAQTSKRQTGMNSLNPEPFFNGAEIEEAQPSVEGQHKIQKLITMDNRWH